MSNVLKFKRLWQIDSTKGKNPDFFPENDLSKLIDWSLESSENISSFIYKGTLYFAVYSKPSWYSFGSDSFKLLDIVVVSKDKDLAIQEFNKLKLEALDVKLECIEIANKFVDKLKDISEIKVIMGRGSVFNPSRLPTGNLDIDIMLFLEFNSESDLEGVFSKIKSIAKNFKEYNFTYSVFDSKFSGEDNYLIPKNAESKIDIALDFLSLNQLIKSKKEVARGLKPYYIEALEYGPIFLDRTGDAFKDLIEYFKSEYKNRGILLKNSD